MACTLVRLLYRIVTPYLRYDQDGVWIGASLTHFNFRLFFTSMELPYAFSTPRSTRARKKTNPLVLTVESTEDKLSQPGRPPDQWSGKEFYVKDWRKHGGKQLLTATALSCPHGSIVQFTLVFSQRLIST